MYQGYCMYCGSPWPPFSSPVALRTTIFLNEKGLTSSKRNHYIQMVATTSRVIVCRYWLQAKGHIPLMVRNWWRSPVDLVMMELFTRCLYNISRGAAAWFLPSSVFCIPKVAVLPGSLFRKGAKIITPAIYIYFTVQPAWNGYHFIASSFGPALEPGYIPYRMYFFKSHRGTHV